jgi:hypothetical protein
MRSETKDNKRVDGICPTANMDEVSMDVSVKFPESVSNFWISYIWIVFGRFSWCVATHTDKNDNRRNNTRDYFYLIMRISLNYNNYLSDILIISIKPIIT